MIYRRRSVTISPEGARAAIYLLLIVVLFVLIGMRGCASDDHEPGCYYDAKVKIPATITSSEGIDFAEVDGWKLKPEPGMSVFIVYKLSEGTPEVTIVYDSRDPMRTTYATEVPITSLQYSPNRINEAISSGFSARIYGSNSNSTANRVVDIIILVIATFLLIRFFAFVFRTLAWKR